MTLKPPPIAAVAFDLDGTLIDTAPDIAGALNQALAAQGLAPASLAAVRGWIGDGPDRLIELALDSRGAAAPPALRAALRAGFDAATLAAPMLHGRVFPGIAELLERWQPALPMVVVTNKPTALSRRVLEAAGILQHFSAVFGADAPAQRKPGPALLQAAAAHLQVEAARLLMVGDSGNDLCCAQAAGCPAAWVAWGYGPCAAPPGMAVQRIETAAALAAWIPID